MFGFLMTNIQLQPLEKVFLPFENFTAHFHRKDYNHFYFFECYVLYTILCHATLIVILLGGNHCTYFIGEKLRLKEKNSFV